MSEMEAPRAVVEKIAKAWLAEAKRLRSSGSCDCGCGLAISLRTRFRPGHDATLLARYRREIRAILGKDPPAKPGALTGGPLKRAKGQRTTAYRAIAPAR